MSAVPRPLQLDAALAATSFRRHMAYRAATLAGLVTNVFFGLMRAFIFIALFRSTTATTVAGYGLRDAVTFTALTQAFIAPLSIFRWWSVAETIETGAIAGDLTKPLGFYRFWLARDLGRAAFQVLARGAPMVLIYALLFDLTWPGSVGRAAAFGLSALLAILISFSWRFTVNLSAFWTIHAYGLGRVAYMSVLLLSGFIVPVTFFPDWLQAIVRWLPFPAMINTPVEVWLGIVDGADLAVALGVQVAWALGLAGLAQLVYRRGVRRLMIQGG